MFKKTTLDNGLRIITAPMTGTNTVTVLVLCGTGSDYESREVAGISHFLEHMFFKGTKKRPQPDIILQQLDAMGSIHNAFTSHEITGYFIKAGKTYLDESLEILADVYKNSLFDKDEIEKEKQIVIEEMHKDKDNPMRRIWDIWEEALYDGQPAGRDVAGYEKTIRTMKRQDFLDYFFHQYVSLNTVVVVAGNFDELRTAQGITSLFGDVRSDKPIRKKPPIRDDQKRPAIMVEYKETDQTHLVIGFRGLPADHPDRYTANVLATLLGGVMSSRMSMKIREKLGLAYAVWSEHESYSNRGYLVTYAGVDHSSTEKTIKAMLGEYKKLADDPATEIELKRVKDYIRGTTLMGLEASNAVASFVGTEEIITGKPLTVEEVFAKIDAISVSDIGRVAKNLFHNNKLNLAVIGPHKDKDVFEGILNLGF